MSKDFAAVPLVDICGLFSADLADRQAVAEEMGRAAREVGFLYITGHGTPQALFDAALDEAKAFFALPLAEKMRSYIGRSVNHSGYVPEGEEVFVEGKVDKKEAFDVNLDCPRSEAPMVGPNLWPDSPTFRGPVGAYYAAVAALARRLFAGFALALGLEEDHFDSRLARPPSQMRLIHYPHDPDAVDQEGIGAHTDYEFFTILRSTAPGLEVRNDRGQWIDAPPIPGAYVVNIGDMLEVWTNGVFTATAHRVRKVTQERYSIPYFAACDYDTVVEPAAAFVSAERPAKYGRLISGEHLFAQTVKTFRYLAPLRERQTA